MLGNIAEYEVLGKTLAEATNCVVVLVDYRLAPEHRFPTAPHDCYAALKWAEENVERLVGKKVPLIVAGDSAGGNLSAVMTLLAREQNGPEISLQVLIYPPTQDNFDNASYLDPENQLLLTRECVAWFWDHYVPDKNDRKHPHATPLNAEDLSGLPPAVIITAGHDVLREEGEAYAAKLIQAGVPVNFRRFPDQIHGFFTLLNLPGSKQGLRFVADAINTHLKAQSTQ